VFSTCTALFARLCITSVSRNKQPLFLYTARTDWCLQLKRTVFSMQYELNLYIQSKIHFIFNGRVMVQVVFRQPVTAKTRVRFRSSPREICGGLSNSNSGFPLSVSSHQYSLLISSNCYCQKVKRAECGNLKMKMCYPGIREYLQEKFLLFCFGFKQGLNHASQSKVMDCR
jgi:hypothetical protein